MSETIALVKTNSLHWVASGIGGVSKRFVRVLEARHIVCKVKDAHYFRNLVCYRLDYVSVSGSLKSSANFKTTICVIVLQLKLPNSLWQRMFATFVQYSSCSKSQQVRGWHGVKQFSNCKDSSTQFNFSLVFMQLGGHSSREAPSVASYWSSWRRAAPSPYRREAPSLDPMSRRTRACESYIFWCVNGSDN